MSEETKTKQLTVTPTELKLKSQEFLKELEKGNNLPDGDYLKIKYADGSTKFFNRVDWALHGERIIDNLKNIEIELL